MKKKKEKTFKINREELNSKIIEIYRTGANVNDIEEFLISIGREKSMRSDIYFANQKINEDARLERETLINVHIKRYEKLYRDNINLDFNSPEIARLQPQNRRFALIDAYVIALDALVAKEKVLGLHARHFRVQLNNFFKKKILAQYNFNKQNLNDLIRLKFLIEKMKSTTVEEIQYFDDLESETKLASEIIDIDHVEINEKSSSKIKEKVTPVKVEEFEKTSIVVEDLKAKILKQDLKKNDPKRKSLLEKLKKHK